MASTKSAWAGHALSILIAALLTMSGVMKLRGGPELAQGFAHLGLPDSMAFPLGLLELACVAVYLVPATSVVGAILLTGYLGGAICTHWRVGDPVVTQIVLGVLVWLALWLREGRLKALIPWRRPADA